MEKEEALELVKNATEFMILFQTSPILTFAPQLYHYLGFEKKKHDRVVQIMNVLKDFVFKHLKPYQEKVDMNTEANDFIGLYLQEIIRNKNNVDTSFTGMFFPYLLKISTICPVAFEL